MYDYKDSKKSVEEILNTELEIKHQKFLPESMNNKWIDNDFKD